MIEFGHPLWLWGIAAAPLVAFASVVGGRLRRRALTSFVAPSLQGTLAPGYSWRRHLAKGLLRGLAVVALFTALAAPRFGSQLVKVERQGIDLVIALDTSLSMLAEDVRPSRLERAKQEIVDVLSGLQGDRVGVVAFAGEAMALCPLTVDYSAALMLVRSVDVYTISEPGSAIGEAIEKSTELFESAAEGDRAIILITDGEDTDGDDPVAAARAAAEKGIRVFAIGLGSPKGELIPERGSDGSVSGYKKDARGETVLSRLDEKTLEAVASASGGKYLPATTEGLEIKVLYEEIAGMQKKLIKGEFIERKKERFWVPLALAFACLLLDALLTTRGARRRGERVRWLHTGVAAALLLALVAPSASAKDAVDRGKVRSANKLYKKGDYKDAYKLYHEALGDTTKRAADAPGVYYNGGNALFMQNQFDRALESYQRSYSPDSTLTGKMLYNRANTLLKTGRFDEAIESYLQALEYLPDDEDARHNLELALAAKQQQKQQQPRKPGDKGKQQQQGGDSQSDSTKSDSPQQQNSKPDSTQSGKPENQEAKPDQSMQQSKPDSSSRPLTEEELRKLSPEDAARILQALQEREEELQKERRKAAFRRTKRSGKDW